MVYANQSNNKMRAKYSLYEGECLVIWEVSSLFNVICMVAHHLNYKLLAFEISANGIKLSHKELVRWALILHEYDFDIVHKVGRVN